MHLHVEGLEGFARPSIVSYFGTKFAVSKQKSQEYERDVVLFMHNRPFTHIGAGLIGGSFFTLSLKLGRRRFTRKWRALNRGFTLIELMIAVAILGTLSAIAVPLYANQIDKARYIKAIADLRIIEKEIIAFQTGNNSLPLDLNQIGRDVLQDPWGNPYQYLNFTTVKGKGQMRKDRFMNPLNSDFDLYSMGKDGITVAPLTAEASYDDIIRAVDGRYMGLASDF